MLTIAKPNSRLVVRLKSPESKVLGPFTYVADLQAPILNILSTFPLTASCGQSRDRTKGRICWLQSPFALSQVKEWRDKTDPDAGFKVLQLRVKAEAALIQPCVRRCATAIPR